MWCQLHNVPMAAYNVRDSVLPHYTCSKGGEVYVLDGTKLQPCETPERHGTMALR